MDHKQIEQSDLIDRYLMGQLSVDEQEQFEEHFVDCAVCVDRLTTTKDLIQGLRHVASHQAAEREAYLPAPIPWYSRYRLAPKWWALASGFLLLIALSAAVIMFNRARLSSTQADQARSDSAEWQRRYQQERESAELAGKKHKETEDELGGRLNELRKELDNNRKKAPGELRPGSRGRTITPQANVQIVILNSTRGSDPRSATNNVHLPISPTNFLLLLALEGEAPHLDYHMSLLDDRGEVILQRGGFRPNEKNSLTFLMNSSLFRPGYYSVRVEGVDAGAGRSIIGEYYFHVTKDL